jgi:glycosyltransferase involved in cell wall biosynthesis
MKKLKIGVVIPVGNNLEYLPRCLESIMNQTQKPEKLIIVLDKVVLNSQILDYVSTIPNAQVFNNSGAKGPAAARNYGYEMGAELDVIVNHDSDDLMQKDRIKIIFDFFTENPLVDILFTDAIFINRYGSPVGDLKPDSKERNHLKILKSLAKKNDLIHPTSAIRTEAFKLVGGYDISFPKMIDYNLYLRLALKNRIFAFLPQKTIYYRIHNEQLSHKKNVGKHLLKMVKLRSKLSLKIGFSIFSVCYLQFYWYFGKLITELGVRKSILRKLMKTVKSSAN